tara:strand:- start:6224 stop:6787 length:564 start_codon:yes stop_codon:yes gene_type:complete
MTNLTNLDDEIHQVKTNNGDLFKTIPKTIPILTSDELELALTQPCADSEAYTFVSVYEYCETTWHNKVQEAHRSKIEEYKHEIESKQVTLEKTIQELAQAKTTIAELQEELKDVKDVKEELQEELKDVKEEYQTASTNHEKVMRVDKSNLQKVTKRVRRVRKILKRAVAALTKTKYDDNQVCHVYCA